MVFILPKRNHGESEEIESREIYLYSKGPNKTGSVEGKFMVIA